MEPQMNKHYCSLKPGDIIEGRYRILYPIKVKAMVRDLKNCWKIPDEMSFPLQRALPQPHPPLEESHYCQVVQINEGNNGTTSATLLLDHGDGNKGSWIKIPLSYEDDIQLIKDGLKKDDHEVFCTLVKILGKEVLGDIKCLPKDPPIMKLPAEVFSMICNHLVNEDLLSLRLVNSAFPHNFLPMDKFWPISTLRIDADEILMFFGNNKNGTEMHNDWGTRCNYTSPRIEIMSSKGYYDVIPQPLTEVKVKWLNTTKKLRLCISLLIHCPDYWETIMNNCTNLEAFDLSARKDNEETRTILMDDQKMNSMYSHVLSRNQGTLKEFGVWLRQGDFDANVLTPYKNLKKVEIYLGYRGSLVNLMSLGILKDTLTSLRLAGIEYQIKKHEVTWIVKNLKNLESLKVQVVHLCEKRNRKKFTYNEDQHEIDEYLMLSILGDCNLVPNLKEFELLFGRCDEEDIVQEDGRTIPSCPEADRIVKAFKGLYKNERGPWTCEYSKDDLPTRDQSMIKCIKIA